MTENQIERIVESKTDSLDREYLSGKIDSSEYDTRCQEIKTWAETEYSKIQLAPYRMG